MGEASMAAPGRELRAIETESYAAIEPKGEVGPAPMLQWLKIADLVVDDSYQRTLAQTGAMRRGGGGNEGRTNVRRIAEGFCWSKFSPVIAAPVEGGRYAIIDGQHRTTAASLRGIESVPCQVVIADRAGQAAAFAAINGATTRMTALVLHHAALAAGEPEAVAIDRAARAAGVRILRSPTAQHHLKAGDMMSVAVLGAALRAYGEAAVIAGLKCVTATRHNRPGVLTAMVVRGLAAIGAEASDPEALIAAVGRLQLDDEVRRAEAMRMGGIPGWIALADQLRGKLRGVLQARAASPAVPGAGDMAAVTRQPLSPRDLQKATEERPVVAVKRAAGVPWSHIANQLGVGVTDLRRRHDPEFTG